MFCVLVMVPNTVDSFIFVGTSVRGWKKIDTFMGFIIRSHSKFLHSSYRKSLIRGCWNSWIGPSKTTKMGTPRNLSHPQYILRFCHRSDGRYGFEKNISRCTVSYTALPLKTDMHFQLTLC